MAQGRGVMGIVLLSLSLLLLSSTLVHALSDSSRLSELQSMKHSASSRLLKFTIDTFEKYIESAPRSYSIFVLFTADPSMCKPCVPMRAQLEKVAKDYEKLPDKKKSSKPVFFAEIRISPNDQNFLGKYAIRHVPIFYAFRTGSSRTYPKAIEDKSPDNYPTQEVGIQANQMKNFVNARTGARFAIVRGGYQIPFVQTVRAFMPVILMIVGLSALLAVVTEAYKNPMFWFGLVMLVYIFSVGGGHYSWIHNQPLAVVNKDGITEYIAGGSRSQYVAEGFFVSATCVSISVLVILLQELPSVLPDKGGQTVVGLGMVMMTMLAIMALLVMYQEYVSFPYHCFVEQRFRMQHYTLFLMHDALATRCMIVRFLTFSLYSTMFST